MIVEVLAVGTELLLGQIVNTNAATIGARLAEAGLDHYHQGVVGDNVERIAAAVRLATSRAGALIITGGIGPTQDDLTREALCVAAGVPMAFSDEHAAALRRRWEERGRAMPESNLRQAQYPEGATLLPNAKGTAPGIRMRIGEAWVFAVPGVPAEMMPMLDDDILPFLRAEAGEGAVVVSRLIRTWGGSESRIAEIVADLYEASSNPTLAFLASSGEIKVRLTAKAASREVADELIAPVEAEVKARLGSQVFGTDDDTVERIVLGEVERRGWSLATAESATAGMVAARLTSVAGASRTFRGGVVAYQDDVKTGVLGVPEDVVAHHGVVSEATACAMADRAAVLFGTEVAVAVTGSAGPEPQERPVGTMVVAVRTPEGTRARSLHFPGDRERVRVYATTAALQLARLAVTGAWWGSGDTHWERRETAE
ncbi:MAG: competence/damage-inducible protein A [Acidimicrobiia bacterium]|jgi:nicotinamide-nucleotide amidase